MTPGNCFRQGEGIILYAVLSGGGTGQKVLSAGWSQDCLSRIVGVKKVESCVRVCSRLFEIFKKSTGFVRFSRCSFRSLMNFCWFVNLFCHCFGVDLHMNRFHNTIDRLMGHSLRCVLFHLGLHHSKQTRGFVLAQQFS